MKYWPSGARLLGAIAVSAAMAAGCGSSGAEGGGSIPIDDLQDQIRSADCAALVRCHVISDQTLCASFVDSAQMGGFGSLGAIVAGVNAGKIQYDGAAARTCFDAIAGASCSSIGGPSGATSPACQQVFTGTLADGSRCIADQECVPGSFCATPVGGIAPGSCDGTCTRGGAQCNDDSQCVGGQVCDTSVPTGTSRGTCITPTPPGAANQPCGTRGVCQAGLTCSTAGTSPVCAPVAQAGQPCALGISLSGGCADGLICALSDDAMSSTCMAPAAKGGSCQVRSQCGGLITSFTCDETTHLCVDLPTSGPCVGPFRACNPLSSYCDTTSGTPTCKPYLSVGDACTLGTLACGFFGGATCQSADPTSVTGTCIAPAAPASCVP